MMDQEGPNQYALEGYLLIIRQKYSSWSPEQREALLNELGVFVERLGENRFDYMDKRKNLAFNGRIARRIRVESGLSHRGLAKILNLPNHLQVVRYEFGKVRPRNPPRNDSTKAYLEWLATKGYNPFNLDFPKAKA